MNWELLKELTSKNYKIMSILKFRLRLKIIIEDTLIKNISLILHINMKKIRCINFYI